MQFFQDTCYNENILKFWLLYKFDFKLITSENSDTSALKWTF